jgi:hypothetical protein
VAILRPLAVVHKEGASGKTSTGGGVSPPFTRSTRFQLARIELVEMLRAGLSIFTFHETHGLGD